MGIGISAHSYQLGYQKALEEFKTKRKLTEMQLRVFQTYTGNGEFNIEKTATILKKSSSTIYDLLQRITRRGWLIHHKDIHPSYEVPQADMDYWCGYENGKNDEKKRMGIMLDNIDCGGDECRLARHRLLADIIKKLGE